jgi:hypothetical protein
LFQQPEGLGPAVPDSEQLAADRADPGLIERQLEGNIHNDYAHWLEPDYPEAGE